MVLFFQIATRQLPMAIILYSFLVYFIVSSRSVARKETLGVHQKNWVCHIYCQINAQKKTKKQACLLGINMLV